MLDIARHRQNANYPAAILWRRVWWGLCRPLLRLVPRQLGAVGVAVLRWHGAKIGPRVTIYSPAEVFYPWNLVIAHDVIIGPRVRLYSLGEIRIEANVLISQDAHLCAGSHDYRQPNLPLLTPPITIREGCWICTEAYIGPGVTVGPQTLVAARAVVVKDAAPGQIVGGHPARELKPWTMGAEGETTAEGAR